MAAVDVLAALSLALCGMVAQLDEEQRQQQQHHRGDEVGVGDDTRGFGVSIHKQSCANAVSSMKDPSNAPRWVKAYWADSVKDSYKAGLEIIALNRNELLSDVLAALADIRVPIYAMNARQVENNCAVISLTIGINNTEHLNRVVARLSKVKDVLKVTRS